MVCELYLNKAIGEKGVEKTITSFSKNRGGKAAETKPIASSRKLGGKERVVGMAPGFWENRSAAGGHSSGQPQSNEVRGGR